MEREKEVVDNVPPITHDGPDRCWKICKCAGCGMEAVCTPSLDFYTLPDDPTKLLYCERCIMTGKDLKKIESN